METLPFLAPAAAPALLQGSASRFHRLHGVGAGGGGELLRSGLIKGKLGGFQPRATLRQESVEQVGLHWCWDACEGSHVSEVSLEPYAYMEVGPSLPLPSPTGWG